jgi:hypothetical protein
MTEDRTIEFLKAWEFQAFAVFKLDITEGLCTNHSAIIGFTPGRHGFDSYPGLVEALHFGKNYVFIEGQVVADYFIRTLNT